MMKNKIHKYDFLIVGAGLIGTLAALALNQKKLKVLVVDKQNSTPLDKRTLAVNANSREFLKKLKIWNSLDTNPQPIEKIVISDYISSSPLIFENSNETMGSVVFNSELLKNARKKLKNMKILYTGVNINLSDLQSNKTISIKKKNYKFNKIILSVGKKVDFNDEHKSILFDNGNYSYVGFFTHTKRHLKTAYEIFNSKGPLAVLPCPSKNEKKSTFIFTTKNEITFLEIISLINKNFSSSHGKINLEKKIHKFPITPFLRKNNKKFIYLGDSLKSIHPVAGQGWNLGIKDIQTLCNLLDDYSIDSEDFNSIYYSKRIIESSLYLGFTSTINFLYENKNPINRRIISFGYESLKKYRLLREVFIKQAMGKSNLIG